MRKNIIMMLLERFFLGRRRWPRLSSLTVLAVIGGFLLWRNNVIPLENTTTAARKAIIGGETLELAPGLPQRSGDGMTLQRKGYVVCYNTSTLQVNVGVVPNGMARSLQKICPCHLPVLTPMITPAVAMTEDTCVRQQITDGVTKQWNRVF